MLPLLLSWGLGTVHPWLDACCRVSALLAGIPRSGAGIGALVVTALAVAAVIGDRRAWRGASHLQGLSLTLGLLGALALLCPVLAMTRPLPWVAAAAALAASIRGQSSGRSDPSWPDSLPHVAGALCWWLALRVEPYGEGLLSSAQQDTLAAWLVSLPHWFGESAVLLIVVGLAAWLWRRAAPSWRSLLAGAASALFLEHMFGVLPGAWLSAAAIGALAAAWPATTRGRFAPTELLLPTLVICLLCGLRLGVAERWDCRSLGQEPGARLLQPGAGFLSIAIVPDNMPFLVLLADSGKKLTRLSPGGGGVSESRVLDKPGGVLVSPPPGTKVIGRLVENEAGVLRVEWWDVFSLQMTAVREVAVQCNPGLSFMEPGGIRQWISCRDSAELLVVDPRPDGPLTRWDMSSPVVGVQRLIGGVLIDQGGADARAGIYDAQGRGLAELAFGPWSTGITSVSEYGEAFVVSRGPAGHIELRGRTPSVEYQRPLDLDTEEGALEALGSLWDSVRVGHWPGRPLWIAGHNSAYVASPFDARIWRVDLEVSWHQDSVSVGAPPVHVVVDSPSETLYGVNRCGVFEVRIKSTFPWRDVPVPTVPATAQEKS